MDLIDGIKYNLRGLAMGLRTPQLLLLGLLRFVAVILITVLAASLIMVYHQEILNLIWSKPESRWILWLWHLLSWFLSLFLVGVSAVLSYLSAQILFSVFIMDYMSRITERLVTGDVKQPEHASTFQQFIYLVKQEIPRTTIPVLLALLLMLLGWLTPLGPIISLISSALLIIFLSWDNTDLLPARRMQAFGVRFTYLRKTLLFHLSFGLLFLVPGLNILFLSFAPVGATLYYLEKQEEAGP